MPQNRQERNTFDKEAMQVLLKDHLTMSCCERAKKPVTNYTRNIEKGVFYVIILCKFLAELS
jgi:hypothetical protein